MQRPVLPAFDHLRGHAAGALLAACLALALASCLLLAVAQPAPASAIVLALLVSLAFIAGVLAALLLVLRRTLDAQGLRQESTALRAQLQEWRDRQDAGRRCIARALHDELGQLLGVMSNELALQRQAGSADRANHADGAGLARLEQALTPAIASLRRIAADLHPRALEDGGLYFALAELARQTSQRHGLPCILQADEAELQVNPAQALALYRIVEEALDNVRRHARARQVSIALWRDPAGLRLCVQDDGRGLPAGTAQARSGMADMRERVRAQDGEFHLSGPPGGGTRLDILLPASPSASPAARPGGAQ